MKLLLLLVLLGCLGESTETNFTNFSTTVKWCVKSDQEMRKCKDLAAIASVFSCVQRNNSLECIKAIKAGEADAITLDGGDVYEAGLNYDLQPIIAEDYGPNSDNCYYAVAVAKQGTGFGFNDLRGKKSCHTGLGKFAGWNIPIGTLVSMGQIQLTDVNDVEEAVSDFFSGSCAPGATPGSKLCQLCKDNCSRSHSERYYDYGGAFLCLQEGAGEVAFVDHLTVPDAEKANYELLCKDGTRASIDSYKTCHLARVPAHAVVSRKDPALAELIYKSLKSIKGFDLFSSDNYAPAKNLMFKDSTVNLVQLPSTTDSFQYLGAEYMSIIRSLNKEQASGAIKWCAVGQAETAKCDTWRMKNNMTKIECQNGDSVEDCLRKILRKEADAIAVDGGQVYTAGKCGLVPAMVEQYNANLCSTSGSASSYYAVAVVKKGSGVTWENLQGKKSCHTGIGRTAGWNIPMGHIHKMTQNCNFSQFFSEGCAPGADPTSSFCALCAGSGKAVGDDSKCKASSDEQYNGYAGAFRCLVEGGGDVAFIKDVIVQENSDGNGPEWAKDVKSADYELICPGSEIPVPITEYASCNLAKVPAHAVVTRPETRSEVVRILKDQQAKFGTSGSDLTYRMFESDGGKNLLFKDSTKCLQDIAAGTTYQTFLGPVYIAAIDMLGQCNYSASDLEKSCTFHSCQQKN
ncbi:serotransferrin-1-like [Centroberyx affinis]|uniref:serotransferrin-1-like n=1 Tax=Centroberyx affinis TaxID=166261 RepID=UPI003A5C6043